MAVDANNEVFEIVTIDGREALFTNLRIDRETVPKGFYCYDIRETEGFSGVAASVEQYVLVNHWGSILTKKSFPLKNGSYEIKADDIDYLGVTCTVELYKGKKSRT